MKKTIFVLAVLAIITWLGFKVMQKPAEAPTINNQTTILMVDTNKIPSQVETTNITIKNFAFSPAEIKIKPGAKVVWTNQDSAPHRIEIANGAKSANLSKGAGFEFIFSKAGEYSYICGIHPSMKGKIIVGK